MIKACLFDLDGTLLDTLTTIAYYGNLALEKFSLPTIDKENYKQLVGDGAKVLIERMLKFINAYDENISGEVYAYYNKSYNSDTCLYTKPYDGILDMLYELKNRNIVCGIISNKPDYATRSVVEKCLPDGLIRYTQGHLDGVKLKPDTKGALDVLKKLGVSAEQTIYIGDTSVDMQTGKNLGAFTIGVLWGFRDRHELEDSGANLIVQTPLQIIDYIDSLQK